MNTAFRRGAAVILLPKFDPDQALALMVQHGATVFTAVPTMYIGLIAGRRPQHGPTAAAVRRLRRCGPARRACWRRSTATFGAEVHEGYGLTETSPAVAFNHVGEPIRPGTVGRPLWGVDVEIADAERRRPHRAACPPASSARSSCAATTCSRATSGNPEASAAAVVDGWFRTGDLGTKDADGIVTIVDRKKDMIIRNGYNVYPSEVEDVMMRHPAVAFAAVFGLPDEAHGQEVHAAVVLLDGHEATPEELVAFVQERIAAYKFPRVVHLVDALPLGGSGKVLKRELVGPVLDAHRVARLTDREARSPRGGPGLSSCRGVRRSGCRHPRAPRPCPCRARPGRCRRPSCRSRRRRSPGRPCRPR